MNCWQCCRCTEQCWSRENTVPASAKNISPKLLQYCSAVQNRHPSATLCNQEPIQCFTLVPCAATNCSSTDFCNIAQSSFVLCHYHSAYKVSNSYLCQADCAKRSPASMCTAKYHQHFYYVPDKTTKTQDNKVQIQLNSSRLGFFQGLVC